MHIFGVAWHDTTDAFNLLMATHPNFNITDHYAASLISFVIRYGRLELIERLLTSPEIDIKTPDKLGRSPLWWAQKQGHAEPAKRLAEHAGSSGLGTPPLDEVAARHKD